MAVLAFSIMMGLRWLNPRLPNVLIAVVVTTALSAMFHFEHNEVVAMRAVDSPRLEDLVHEFNIRDGTSAAGQRSAVARRLAEH